MCVHRADARHVVESDSAVKLLSSNSDQIKKKRQQGSQNHRVSSPGCGGRKPQGSTRPFYLFKNF